MYRLGFKAYKIHAPGWCCGFWGPVLQHPKAENGHRIVTKAVQRGNASKHNVAMSALQFSLGLRDTFGGRTFLGPAKPSWYIEQTSAHNGIRIP